METSILKQLEKISLSKEEISAGMKYCNMIKDQYYKEIDNLNNAIKTLEQSKETSLIYVGTPEELSDTIKSFEEGRDKYIQEESEGIAYLESFIKKLTVLVEIL